MVHLLADLTCSNIGLAFHSSLCKCQHATVLTMLKNAQILSLNLPELFTDMVRKTDKRQMTCTEDVTGVYI